MSIAQAPTESVQLDELAASKLTEFIEAQGDGEACLRLGVRGGGCSGYQYMLALDTSTDDDLVFESEGHTILVDPASYFYVAGATITYKDGLSGAGFDVQNPRATSACGCGSSFRVDGEQGCDSESAL